jgi:hypothetical protein
VLPLAVEIGLKEVSGIITGAGIAGGLIGWLAFRASRAFRQLRADEAANKAVAASTAADGYKQLYEIEKERGGQLLTQMADFKREIATLRDQLVFIRTQNVELLELNLKWQMTVRTQDNELATARDTIKRQEDEIDGLERKQR